MVDLILLTTTALDLRGGGTATFAHSLAAIYIGVSVGFGHRMVQWADQRFAHRYAGGPPPPRKPRHGAAHAAHERRALMRHVIAWAVGCGLLLLAVATVGDPDRTASLSGTIRLWTLVLAVDALISLSYTVRPRRAPASPSRARPRHGVLGPRGRPDGVSAASRPPRTRRRGASCRSGRAP